jgi:phospholipid/cholesterol/gamma-HCH transport system substrate-binding protein
MRQNVVETILGGVVLVVAAGFLAWAYGRSDAGDPGGYVLIARFDKADGLDVGSDVRISGIKVGQVQSTALDPQSFRAEVRFSVARGIELPKDTSAAVVSASLLGGKYLALQPGGEDAILKDGEVVSFTQSSVNLEELIGRFIFSGAPGAQGGAAPPAAP